MAFPERRVLGFIDPFGAGQEGRDLLHENPVLRDPRPVERDPAQADHARRPAQRQRLYEQVPERRQVPPAEFGDRPIVRGRASGQPPKGHIIDAPAFDHPRRPHSGGVGVQQERHQPRIVGQPTARLGVRTADAHKIQMLVDQFGNEPGQVLRRQAVIQRRRHRQSMIGPNTRNVLFGGQLRPRRAGRLRAVQDLP